MVPSVQAGLRPTELRRCPFTFFAVDNGVACRAAAGDTLRVKVPRGPDFPEKGHLSDAFLVYPWPGLAYRCYAEGRYIAYLDGGG